MFLLTLVRLGYGLALLAAGALAWLVWNWRCEDDLHL